MLRVARVRVAQFISISVYPVHGQMAHRHLNISLSSWFQTDECGLNPISRGPFTKGQGMSELGIEVGESVSARVEMDKLRSEY